jgi:uncharacterized protein (UPF0333 family)
MQRKKRGQSTLEYIILVAAVIAALLFFLPNAFQTSYDATLTTTADTMNQMANRIAGSRPLSP